MNLLLIGGTGVLSSAVTSEAQKKGISVTMINRGNRRIPDGVEHIKADKDDVGKISDALKGRTFDAVMDFLCYTDAATEKSFKIYSRFAKQYFYVSSMAVYDWTIPGPLVEDHPKPLSVWSYSINKWKSEQKLQVLAKQTDCKVTVIRPSVTYGNTRIPYGIYPRYGYHWTLCARILSDKPIITWNHGENAATMLRVEDFAVGMVGLVGNPKAYGEAFNICSSSSTTFGHVLEIVGDFLHHDVKTIDLPVEWYAHEMPDRAGELKGGRVVEVICKPEEVGTENSKIKTFVPEFKETISVEDGIRMTLEAYKKQNYQNGIDWKFDAETDRIINKWCRIQGIDSKQFHIGFVDYFGNATRSNRILYWRELNKNVWAVKVIIGSIRFFKGLFK